MIKKRYKELMIMDWRDLIVKNRIRVNKRIRN
jgi:hypothetical protein